MTSGGIRYDNSIPDGFSYFDAGKMLEYNKISSKRPNFELFEKIGPSANKYGLELTQAEIDFYDRLSLLGIKFDLIKTTWEIANDLVMLGREWELKTISKKTEDIIKYVFWKISDQGKRNAILDVSYLNRKLEWVFSKIARHLSVVRKGEYRELDGAPIRNYDLFDSIIVVRGLKLIRYK